MRGKGDPARVAAKVRLLASMDRDALLAEFTGMAAMVNPAFVANPRQDRGPDDDHD
jgi:hypothetical protein